MLVISVGGAPISRWIGHAADRILDCGLDELGSRRERESFSCEDQRDDSVNGAPQHLYCKVHIEVARGLVRLKGRLNDVRAQSEFDLSRTRRFCPVMADCVAKVVLHWRSKILRAAGASFV